jgi:hypothetical protein
MAGTDNSQGRPTSRRDDIDDLIAILRQTVNAITTLATATTQIQNNAVQNLMGVPIKLTHREMINEINELYLRIDEAHKSSLDAAEKLQDMARRRGHDA